MNELNNKICMIAASVAIILSILSIFLSLKVNQQASRNFSEMITSIENLKTDITSLQKDLKNLESRQSGLNRMPTFSRNNRSPSNSQNNTAIARSNAGRRLRDIVEPSLPERDNELAENLDQERPAQVSERISRWLEARQQIMDLRAINADQAESDRVLYSDNLITLYNKADIRTRNASEEEQKNAFETLIAEYPDAYATAKAISMWAQRSIRNGNLDEAEAYTNKLRDFEERNSTSVVLDLGYDALPLLLNSMSWAYYRDGRIDDSKRLMEELESNYSYANIPIISQRRRALMTTVPQAVNSLRERMDNNR